MSPCALAPKVKRMNDFKKLAILIAGAFVPAFLCFTQLAQGAVPVEDERPAAIASILETYEPWWQDLKEEPVARKARLLLLATAQVEAVDHMTCAGKWEGTDCVKKFDADPLELYALLLTAGWWETRYNSRIHAGNCGEDECDGGRARGVYQVHLNGTYPEEIWYHAEGDDFDSTLNATEAAAYSLSSAWKACKKRAGTKGVWAAYGRGACYRSYPGMVSRHRWSRRQLRALRKVMPGAKRKAFAHEYTIKASKGVVAGTSGQRDTVFWVIARPCSDEWLQILLDEHGASMRELSFVEAQCFKHHANSPPLTVTIDGF